MGEAKRRKEWIAAGGEDLGVVDYRRRFRMGSLEVGLLDVGWARRAEMRRRNRRLHALKQWRVAQAVARVRYEKRDRSPIVVGLQSKKRNERKRARRALRAAGGVIGRVR